MSNSSGRKRHSIGSRQALFACSSVVLSMLFALGLLEIGLRVYHARKARRELDDLPPVAERALVPSADPELVYEWNPGFRKGDFSVNSFGMADREVTVEKPRGVFRIAFVGDSISAAFGLRARSEIYVNVLSRMLERGTPRGGRFEVLNFAVNGYDLLQEARVVESRVRLFNPDLVIVQLCLNDPYPSPNPYVTQQPNTTSMLWRFLFRRIWPDRFWSWTFVDRNYDARGIQSVRSGFSRLASAARGQAPVVAFLFPYFHSAGYERWGFGRYHEIFRKEAAEAEVPFVDLYEPFRKAGFIRNRPYPADPLHPDVEAHAFAAATILKELDRRHLLPVGNSGQSE